MIDTLSIKEPWRMPLTLVQLRPAIHDTLSIPVIFPHPLRIDIQSPGGSSWRGWPAMMLPAFGGSLRRLKAKPVRIEVQRVGWIENVHGQAWLCIGLHQHQRVFGPPAAKLPQVVPLVALRADEKQAFLVDLGRRRCHGKILTALYADPPREIGPALAHIA
ncbi:hypothetical protein [Dyella sp. OK004]|uniref:hypothetical protein n=1 Tax=Dyella sp. OK004 TaxID=1855292 RepID=UPI0015A6C878|nr:hypothetical protein [Dyella sp. OK004]